MGTISYDIPLFLELDIFMATAFWKAFFPNFISVFIYKTQISWVILSFLGLSSIVRLIQMKFLQAFKKNQFSKHEVTPISLGSLFPVWQNSLLFFFFPPVSLNDITEVATF